jgi:hypothetical protein
MYFIPLFYDMLEIVYDIFFKTFKLFCLLFNRINVLNVSSIFPPRSPICKEKLNQSFTNTLYCFLNQIFLCLHESTTGAIK